MTQGDRLACRQNQRALGCITPCAHRLPGLKRCASTGGLIQERFMAETTPRKERKASKETTAWHDNASMHVMVASAGIIIRHRRQLQKRDVDWVSHDTHLNARTNPDKKCAKKM